MKIPFKIIAFILLAAAIALALLQFNYFSYLNFDFIKSQKQILASYINLHPYQSKIYFFLAYVTLASLSIPGALFLVLLSPSFYSLFECYIITVTASSTGASLSFLLFRFFLKDFVNKLFKKQIHKHQKQITENQKPFLLSLRLIPIFPFSWVNIIYSVTNIKLIDFFILTFIGMTPGIFVNLYAGLQLSKINTISDLYSPQIIGAFLLMAFFPLMLKPLIKKFLN